MLVVRPLFRHLRLAPGRLASRVRESRPLTPRRPLATTPRQCLDQHGTDERSHKNPSRILRPGELIEQDFEENNRELDELGEDSDGVEVVGGTGDSGYEDNLDEGCDEDAFYDEGQETGLPEPQNPVEAEIYRRVERNIRLANHNGKEQIAEDVSDGEGTSETVSVEEEGNAEDHRWGSDRFFKTHPLTAVGRFATFPTTIQLPEAVQDTTNELLGGVVHKHLLEAAWRCLGGAQFPHSPIATEKRSKRILEIPLRPKDTRMSEKDADVFISAVLPGLYAEALSALTELRKRLGGDWVLGGDGAEPGVKRVLDFGGGGSAILAWKSIIAAEQDLRNEELMASSGFVLRMPKSPPQASLPIPPARAEPSWLDAVVVIGSAPLRKRVSKFLSDASLTRGLADLNPHNTSRLPATYSPESTPGPQAKKLYDLIICTNGLLPLHEFYERRVLIDNLWSHLNPKGGVVLFIEKGTPMGFEAIAGARSTILKNKIADTGPAFQPTYTGDSSASQKITKETSAIIAPCTNHEQCPMFLTGHTDGTQRKDYCRFSQRYERPSYLQKLMKMGKKNHEDLEYSYLAVRRGIDHRRDARNHISPDPEEFKQKEVDSDLGSPIDSPYTMGQLRNYSMTLPRVILRPIKRQGHVTLDLCTPQGNIERWTVPRSYNKLAYRDARKSSWGDLWALGAKTKCPRNIKIGGKENKVKSKLKLIVDKFGAKKIVKDRSNKVKLQLKRKKREKAKEEKLIRQQQGEIERAKAAAERVAAKEERRRARGEEQLAGVLFEGP